MKENILVTISGSQFYLPDASPNDPPIEIVTPGNYEHTDTEHLIRYTEAYEGTDSTTVNEIHIMDDSILVTKEGVITTNMVFAEGKRGVTYYTTPFGTIEMGISTTDLKKDIQPDRIDLMIGYALSMNGDHVADCKLHVTAESN